MTESTKLTSDTLRATTAQTRVFGEGAAVRRRATAAREQNSAGLDNALNRLARLLNSGEPLSKDVPRGHYLNILV